MDNTTNELLEALLNGDTENIEPRSRVETFLLAMCEKMGVGGITLSKVILPPCSIGNTVILGDEESAVVEKACAEGAPLICAVTLEAGGSIITNTDIALHYTTQSSDTLAQTGYIVTAGKFQWGLTRLPATGVLESWSLTLTQLT